jgi:hypothetical protein
MATKSEGLGCIVVTVIVIAIVAGGYSQLDSIGWIQHHGDGVITVQGNWLVGEIKDCTSIPLGGESAKILDRPVGDVTWRIDCGDGPSHTMTITFYGKKEQPETAGVAWKCTRREDSFLCKQTGAYVLAKSSSNSNTYQTPDKGDLCNNRDHMITESELREYAREKGISPNDAAQEVVQAGCGIVADQK